MYSSHLNHLFILWTLYFEAAFSISDFVNFAFAKIEYGVIQGKIEKHGDTLAEVYNSIPYAANPTGDLRFESPKAPEKWRRPFDTNFEVICPQYHIVPAIYKIPLNESENCLFMKVIIPLGNDKKRFQEKLPIVYWIHGMSYTKGGKYVYRSSGVIKHFASQKIIFVAVDYRLGFDGFLSLHHHDLGGNFGFKDIVFGLEFVKRNAENFGGDSEKIVLGGESVGGSLAGLLAASPRSKGLISGAMLFSGTTLTSWAQRNEFTKINSEMIIAHCNCTRRDESEMKECMKKIDPKCYRENLHSVKWDFLWDSPERLMYEILRMGFTLATPVIDGYRKETALLPENPLKLVSENQQNLSLLISHVSHERATGMLYSVWGSKLPASYYVNALIYSKSPASQAIRKILRKRYAPLGDIYDQTETTRLLTRLVQDELVSDGEKEGNIYSQKGNKVFMLLSDVFGEPTGGQNMSLASEHCMDMVFLFDEPHLCNPLLVLSDEMKSRGAKFAQKFSRILAEFVHNSSINESPKYGRKSNDFLRISWKKTTIESFSQDSFFFWQQLIPTLQRMNVTLPESAPVNGLPPTKTFAWKEFLFGLTVSLLISAIVVPTLYYLSRRKRVQTSKN